MKLLLSQLYLCAAPCLGAWFLFSTPILAEDKAALKNSPRIEECFQVNWLLRADEAHYWADWVNTCPYTIDSVYVMVGFVDHAKKPLGNGVWPMYFVLSGAHQVTRFSAPAEVAGFDALVVHRITIDSVVAFSEDRSTVQSAGRAPAPNVVKGPTGVHDTGIGRVVPAH